VISFDARAILYIHSQVQLFWAQALNMVFERVAVKHTMMMGKQTHSAPQVPLSLLFLPCNLTVDAVFACCLQCVFRVERQQAAETAMMLPRVLPEKT
jgi:hypothetical protein